MKNLTKYAAKSDIMNFAIEYGGKTYKFNLDEELKISEEGLNTEVKNHARSHAFLLMLHKKLSIKLHEAQKELRRKSDKLFTEFSKTEDKVTVAKAKAAADPKLQIQEQKIAQMEELRDYVGVAVESFRVRKDLLQTLAANTRIETKL